MLLPAACNLARLWLFGLKFSKLNVCLRLNFVPCAVEVTSEWGVQKEADWDQKNSAKILELFSEQNQGKCCLPMAIGIWQTWKAVMPFHLSVTDLKSDVRGGAHILEVSLLLPPWKVHLHLVKCPKPNCTVCIFSRCLLGHAHILLSSSWWPDNTRDISKYSNSDHSHDLPPLVTLNRGLWQQSPRCYIMNPADEGRWHTYATLGCLSAFWHFS